MEGKSYKVWGVKHRIYEDRHCEIDILYIKKDTFCSIHKHLKKHNQFHVLSGILELETDYVTTVFGRRESSPDVKPGTMHRFRAKEDAVVVEVASVASGYIDPKDIDRLMQGGRVVNGKDVTDKELKRRNKLKFNYDEHRKAEKKGKK